METNHRLEDTEIIPWIRCPCGKVLGNLQSEYQLKLVYYRNKYMTMLNEAKTEDIEEETEFSKKIRGRESEILEINKELDLIVSYFCDMQKILRKNDNESNLKEQEVSLQKESDDLKQSDTLEDLFKKIQKKEKEKKQLENEAENEGNAKKIRSINRKIKDYEDRLEKIKKREEILENLKKIRDEIGKIQDKKKELNEKKKKIAELNSRINHIRTEIEKSKFNRRLQIEKYEFENSFKNLKKNNPELFSKYVPKEELTQEENNEREKLRKRMADLETRKSSIRALSRRSDFIDEISQKKTLEEIGLKRACCVSNIMSDIVIPFSFDEKLEISVQPGIINDGGLKFSNKGRRVLAR